MAILAKDRVECPNCSGAGYEMFSYDRQSDTGQPCTCCGGSGSVPLSEVAERCEWSDQFPDSDFADEAEAEACLSNLDL